MAISHRYLSGTVLAELTDTQWRIEAAEAAQLQGANDARIESQSSSSMLARP